MHSPLLASLLSLLGLGLLAGACASPASLRRTVAAQPSARPTPAPEPHSLQHAHGPWHQRRGAFAADGPAARPREAWRATLGAPITHTLTTDGEVIYVVSGTTVFALDARGQTLWFHDANATGPVAPLPTGPAVATASGAVLSLARDTGERAEAWVGGGPSGLAVPIGHDIGWATQEGSLRGASGWEHQPAASAPAAGGAASTGDRILFSTSRGALVAADLQGIVWEAALPGPGVGHPATDGSTVVAAYGAGQGHSGGVAAFRVEDGTELWRWGLSLEPAASPALGQLVLVPDLGGALTALHPETGAVVWQTSSDFSWSATPAIGRMGAFATEVHGRVSRIDLDDGGEVWSVDLRAAIAAAPVLVGDTLVVGLANGDVVGLAP